MKISVGKQFKSVKYAYYIAIKVSTTLQDEPRQEIPGELQYRSKEMKR